MPEKKAAIPKREAPIGLRLREARELLRLTQSEFAEQVGINRQRLASYEELRAPLRYDIALKICRQFIFSEKWLATGKGLQRQFLDLTSEALTYRIPVDAPFGQVFDQYLAPLYEKIRKTQGDGLRIRIAEGDNFEFVTNLFYYNLERWLRELPRIRPMPEQYQEALCAFLLRKGTDFVDFVVANNRLPGPEDLGDVNN